MSKNYCIRKLVIEREGTLYAKFTINGVEYLMPQEDLYFAIMEVFITGSPQIIEVIASSTEKTADFCPKVGHGSVVEEAIFNTEKG